MLTTLKCAALLACVALPLGAQGAAKPQRQCIAGVCTVGEAALQARARGVDYNALIRRAAANDTTALRSFFRLSNSRIFDGAGSSDHCEVMRALLVRWGDARFAGVLARESMTTQFAVSKDLNSVAKPGDAQKYPRSLALAAPA
jgi:hypothetical protein